MIATDFRRLARSTRNAPAPASAVPAIAPSDFENLVQRLVAYKPEHQFKVLAARLKAQHLLVVGQAGKGRLARA